MWSTLNAPQPTHLVECCDTSVVVACRYRLWHWHQIVQVGLSAISLGFTFFLVINGSLNRGPQRTGRLHPQSLICNKPSVEQLLFKSLIVAQRQWLTRYRSINERKPSQIDGHKQQARWCSFHKSTSRKHKCSKKQASNKQLTSAPGEHREWQPRSCFNHQWKCKRPALAEKYGCAKLIKNWVSTMQRTISVLRQSIDKPLKHLDKGSRATIRGTTTRWTQARR